MKKTMLIAGLLMVVMPLVGSAEIIRVKVDVPTVQAAVSIAQDGDTLVIPADMSFTTVNTEGKDLTIGIDNLEPPGAKPDSTVTGSNNPFPQSPLE